MTQPMPRDYTTAEADAHEAGWHGAVNAAIAAIAAIPVGAECQPHEGPFARGSRAGRAMALQAAADALASLTPPARPSPTRLGILGEG
jgi:hypothetical protein